MENLISIILDKRNGVPKKNGKYPVKLMVYSARLKVNKRFSTKYDLTEKDFASIWETERPRKEYREIRNELHAIELRANSICKTLKLFSFDAFEKKYFGSTINKDTLNSAFSDYSKELRESERIGTAVSYECAQSSLNKFFKDAKFTDITPEALTKYEKWMLNNGNSVTTIGIYLRSLRTWNCHPLEDKNLLTSGSIF